MPCNDPPREVAHVGGLNTSVSNPAWVFFPLRYVYKNASSDFLSGHRGLAQFCPKRGVTDTALGLVIYMAFQTNFGYPATSNNHGLFYRHAIRIRFPSVCGNGGHTLNIGRAHNYFCVIIRRCKNAIANKWGVSLAEDAPQQESPSRNGNQGSQTVDPHGGIISSDLVLGRTSSPRIRETYQYRRPTRLYTWGDPPSSTCFRRSPWDLLSSGRTTSIDDNRFWR